MLALMLTAALAAVDPPTGFGLPADADQYLPLWVLRDPDVRKELKLAPDQVKALRAIEDAIPARIVGRPPSRATADEQLRDLGAGLDAEAARVLTADQLPRYRQIVWQAVEFADGAAGMATNPAAARAIGLTPEQVGRARAIRERADAEFDRLADRAARSRPGGVQNGRPVAGADRIAARASAGVVALLTADQKKAWNALLGEPLVARFQVSPWSGPFKAPAAKR